MALRDAAARQGTHLIENGTLYSSSEPCPMCLTGCYWARISRIVFGATSHDVATYGFEDLHFYRELSQPPEHRSLREDAAAPELRDQAADACGPGRSSSQSRRPQVLTNGQSEL